MADLTAVQTKNNNLIRKTLNCSVFLAAYSQAAPTAATMFDTTSGALVAGGLTGYIDLGFLTVAGPQFNRQVNVSDVESLQSQTPTRSDVTSDVITVQVTGQELNKNALALQTGADPSGITAGSNGVVEVSKPAIANAKSWRLVAIAQDNLKTTGEPIYLVRFLPSASVTDYQEQSMSKGDDPILNGVTFRANYDSVLGTDHKWWVGGEGAKTTKTAMGF